MNHLLTATELERLGLQGAVVSEVVEHEIPEEIARGRAVPLHRTRRLAAVTALLASIPREGAVPLPRTPAEPVEVTETEAQPLSLGTVCRETMGLDLVGSQVRVTARDEVPLRAMALDEAVTFKVASSHEVRVSGTGRVVIQRPDGLVLVVALEEGRLRHQELEVQAEPVPEFAKVEIDLGPYIAAIEDPWLGALVAAHDQEDAWTRLVGLGIVRRYLPLSVKDKKALVQQILEGQWEAPTEPWSKTLGPVQVETIVALVTAAGFELRRDLAELMENFTPSEPTWVEEWVRICHMRDDLEGVAWLLPCDEIRDFLRELDKWAQRVTAVIPPGLAPYDERLLRALAVQWDVWWVEPVRDPADFDLPI